MNSTTKSANKNVALIESTDVTFVKALSLLKALAQSRSLSFAFLRGNRRQLQ